MPSDPWTLAAAEVLLGGLLKATIILALAGLGVLLLHRRSAAIRYSIWRLAFGSLLCLPAFATLVPSWHVDLMSWNEPEKASSLAVDLPGRYPLSAGPASQDFLDTSASTDHLAASESFAAARHEGGEQNLVDLQPASTRSGWALMILGVWALGVLYAGCRIVRDLIHVALITRCAEPLPSARQLAYASQVAQEMAIRRPIRYMRSRAIGMPMVWGLRRPVLVFPDEVADWTDERLRIVLLHELAHVKRWDYLTHLLVQAVCTIYWMNPLAWLAARRIAMEQERACDDAVLLAGVPSQTYARHLLALAEPPEARMPTGLAMGRFSMLKERVQALLNPHISRHRITRRTNLATLLTTLAVTGLLAAFQPWPPPTPKPLQDTLHQAITSLADPNPAVRQRAAWSLGELESESAVEALAEGLRDEDPGVRNVAAWALGEIKDRRAVPALILALKDEDRVVLEMAVRALGEVGDPLAVEPLFDALADPRPDIRAAAIWALGEIRSPHAVLRVVKALSDSSDQVRLSAIDVLAHLDDWRCCARHTTARQAMQTVRQEAVHSLSAALSDASPEVRQRAVGALGRLEPTVAREHLMKQLVDPHPAVRTEVAHTLGVIGDPYAVEALLDRLRDEHPDVRAMAAWALDEINVP